MSPPLYQLNKDPLDIDLLEGEVVIVSDGEVSFSICDYGALRNAGQVENEAVDDLPKKQSEIEPSCSNKDPLVIDLLEGEVVIVSNGEVSFSICDYEALQNTGQVENEAVDHLPENKREGPFEEKQSEIKPSCSTVKKIEVEEDYLSEDVGPNELVDNKPDDDSKHLGVHKKREERSQCPQCSKDFKFKSQLKYHIRSHTKPFKCTHCPKTFSLIEHFNIHLRSHTGEQDDLLEDNDPHEFVDNEPDDDSNNSKESPKSKSPKHLEVHEKTEKRFNCSQCSKAFVFKTQLKYHFRVHTGEKPFKCTHCPKTYTQNRYLQIHLRSHTGEKPFCCPQCLKSFVSNYTLRKHLLLHTGEKPFKCSFCSKTYLYKAGLANHLQDHEDLNITSI